MFCGRIKIQDASCLFSTQAGEGGLVVDGDCWSFAATATATATIFTTVATIATATATTTELATVATVSAITTEITTVTSLSTTTTTAAPTTTSTGFARLLLEGVVNVEELLLRGTLTFASGLLFALEVVRSLVFGQFFGRLPFLVLLGALIWCTSFLEAKPFELLSCLFGQIVGIGLVAGFRLGFTFRKSITAFRDGDRFGILIEGFGLATSIPSAFLFFLLSDCLSSLFVCPFALASGLTPAMTRLLRVFSYASTVDMTVATTTLGWASTTSSSRTSSALHATRLVAKAICASTFASGLITVVGSASCSLTECFPDSQRHV